MEGFLPCRFLFSPRTLSLRALSPTKLFPKLVCSRGFLAGYFLTRYFISGYNIRKCFQPDRFSSWANFSSACLHTFIASIFWSVVEELESREEFVKEMRQLGASQRVIRSKLIVCIFKILTLFRMALKICSQGRLEGGKNFSCTLRWFATILIIVDFHYNTVNLHDFIKL
jgi:hypothetical protein